MRGSAPCKYLGTAENRFVAASGNDLTGASAAKTCRMMQDDAGRCMELVQDKDGKPAYDAWRFVEERSKDRSLHMTWSFVQEDASRIEARMAMHVLVPEDLQGSKPGDACLCARTPSRVEACMVMHVLVPEHLLPLCSNRASIGPACMGRSPLHHQAFTSVCRCLSAAPTSRRPSPHAPRATRRNSSTSATPQTWHRRRGQTSTTTGTENSPAGSRRRACAAAACPSPAARQSPRPSTAGRGGRRRSRRRRSPPPPR